MDNELDNGWDTELVNEHNRFMIVRVQAMMK